MFSSWEALSFWSKCILQQSNTPPPWKEFPFLNDNYFPFCSESQCFLLRSNITFILSEESLTFWRKCILLQWNTSPQWEALLLKYKTYTPRDYTHTNNMLSFITFTIAGTCHFAESIILMGTTSFTLLRSEAVYKYTIFTGIPSLLLLRSAICPAAQCYITLNTGR